MYRWASRLTSRPRGASLSETPGEGWESDDCVRRTVVLPAELAERRGLSVSDLLAEYAAEGLRRARAGS